MSLKKIKRAEKKGTESVMDEKFALLFWAQFPVGTGENSRNYQVNNMRHASKACLSMASQTSPLRHDQVPQVLALFSHIPKCQTSADFCFTCSPPSGVRALSARGGDRTREPRAARVGHDPVGQRLRRVGPTAVPGAGQGEPRIWENCLYFPFFHFPPCPFVRYPGANWQAP